MASTTSLNLYDFSVPLFIRYFNTLDFVLNKATEFAKQDSSKTEAMLKAMPAWTLYENKDNPKDNMLPLSTQIYIASNAAKFAVNRILGNEGPTWNDRQEWTVELLRERIKLTLDFLKAVEREDYNGKDDVTINWKYGTNEVTATSLQYLQFHAIPTFYFHVVTAYDILRHHGVPIGKIDYLGAGETDINKLFA